MPLLALRRQIALRVHRSLDGGHQVRATASTSSVRVDATRMAPGLSLALERGAQRPLT
jgi:hypothetical protein